MRELVSALADLVLPAACAGCDAERVPLRHGVCDSCVRELAALAPFATRPSPPPRGMPQVTAVGTYAGAMRGVLLAYKEKGRHRLARPLGALLAGAIAQAAQQAGGGPRRPLVLVAVPSTGAAARARHGDHLARLTRHAMQELRRNGWQVTCGQPLRAGPKPDSVTLDAPGRAAAAENSLTIRPARIRILRRRMTMRSTLIVVDDIVTTGATLAAVTTRLTEANMQVAGAATLAATVLRRPVRSQPGRFAARAESPRIATPNEG